MVFDQISLKDRNSFLPTTLAGGKSENASSPSLAPAASLAFTSSDVASSSHLPLSNLARFTISRRAAARGAMPGHHYSSVDENEPIIAIVGITGSGKSSFVNTAARREAVAVGNSLNSLTREVQPVKCLHPDGRRKIVLVDTPGFDDTNLSDAQILKIIAHWLKKTYQKNVKLTCLLYLHPISNVRMGGTTLRNLAVFKDLCGYDNLKNVVLVTTMWNEVSDESVGSERERQLLSDFWKDMVDHGSRTYRFKDNPESAWEIIDCLDFGEPRQRRISLQIQREMVDKGLSLGQTSAAKTLSLFLAGLGGKVKKAFGKLFSGTRHDPSELDEPAR